MTTAVTKTVAPSRAVAIKTDEDLREFLFQRSSEFAVLAKAAGVEPEVLVAELVVAARKRPEILACSPESIVTFMYDSAKTGLVVGRGCFPVPVRDNRRGVTSLECWIGADGMRELAIYGRGARDVYAYVHFEGDYFEELLGSWSEIKHKPGPNFGNMAKAVGVYAVAVISQTVHRHLYLRRERIEQLRALNRGDTRKPDSPWVKHEEAMWKAKAILALCKTLPRNPRLAAAMAVIERNENIQLDPESGELRPAARIERITGPGDASAEAQPTEFEVEEEVPAPFRFPNWAGHPLANRTLADCETPALAQLQKDLTKAHDRGQTKFSGLLPTIEAELEERRNAVAV